MGDGAVGPGGGVGPAPGAGIGERGGGGDRGDRGDRGERGGDRGGGGGDGWRGNRMPRRRDRDRQGARSLHVRGYNVASVGDRELRQVFEEFGQVVDVYLPRDYFTKDLRGFAYVQFANENDADAARRKLDHQDIFKDGREVHIMWAAGERKTPNDMRRIDVLRDNPHARRARMGAGGPPDWHRGRSRSPGRKRMRSMSPRRGYRDRSPYRGGRGYPRRRSRSPRRRSRSPRRERDRHHSPYSRSHRHGRDRDRDRSPRRRSPPPRSPRRTSRSPRRTDSPHGRRDSRSPPTRRNSRSPPPKRRAASRDRSPPIRRRRSISPDGGWRHDRSPHGNGVGRSDMHGGPNPSGNGNDVNGDDGQPSLRSAPPMSPNRNELAGEAH